MNCNLSIFVIVLICICLIVSLLIKNYNDNFLDNNNLLDTKIPNLKHVGINYKPCPICQNEKGHHYHSLHKYSKKHANFASTGHYCKACKNNPGKLHVHYN